MSAAPATRDLVERTFAVHDGLEPDQFRTDDSMAGVVGSAPRLDAESSAALAALPTRSHIADLGEFIASLRATAPFEASDDELTLGGTFELSERSFTAMDGAERTLLVCHPRHRFAPGPAIYFVHGGGMVSGGPRTGLLEILQLAAPIEATVVSVDYRLAPEHADPLPREDTYAGLRAVQALSAELGIDDHRIAVIGSSAGGALAAGSALMARDDGDAPAAGLMLLNPMLDDRNDSFSAHQMDGVDQWDREANHYGWQALLGMRRTEEVSSYTAPARATSLAGLPPVFIDVGSAETLRDECVRYADSIWRSGGVAELHVWAGGFHGYEFVAPHSRLAQETWETRERWLRRTLAE